MNGGRCSRAGVEMTVSAFPGARAPCRIPRSGMTGGPDPCPVLDALREHLTRESRYPMAANCSDQPGGIAPAMALAELLTTHPELAPEASGLTWALTPAGVLHAELHDARDGGLAVDRCARAMGSTPVRTCHSAGADRECIAELTGSWHGVPVEVWETFRTPEPDSILQPRALSGGDR